MSRKRYPEEFKVEAVKQVTEAGYSVYDVAERLGTVSTVGSGDMGPMPAILRRYRRNRTRFDG
jgi:hypothetical protein